MVAATLAPLARPNQVLHLGRPVPPALRTRSEAAQLARDLELPSHRPLPSDQVLPQVVDCSVRSHLLVDCSVLSKPNHLPVCLEVAREVLVLELVQVLAQITKHQALLSSEGILLPTNQPLVSEVQHRPRAVPDLDPPLLPRGVLVLGGCSAIPDSNKIQPPRLASSRNNSSQHRTTHLAVLAPLRSQPQHPSLPEPTNKSLPLDSSATQTLGRALACLAIHSLQQVQAIRLGHLPTHRTQVDFLALQRHQLPVRASLAPVTPPKQILGELVSLEDLETRTRTKINSHNNQLVFSAISMPITSRSRRHCSRNNLRLGERVFLAVLGTSSKAETSLVVLEAISRSSSHSKLRTRSSVAPSLEAHSKASRISSPSHLQPASMTVRLMAMVLYSLTSHRPKSAIPVLWQPRCLAVPSRRRPQHSLSTN